MAQGSQHILRFAAGRVSRASAKHHYEAGLKFYDDLFDEILANDMEPMITISHYEIPLNLTLKYKGWYSRDKSS